MSTLFSSLTLRSITFRNRIFVSPMCQYCSDQGLPTDWHLVHLGSRAVGGAGLVMVEATAVSPEGRITPAVSGIWSDAHAEAFTPITRFIREQGAVPGIQLAHAGRNGSCSLPWLGGNPLGPEACGWQTLGSSAVPFAVGHPAPHAISLAEMDEIEAQFRAEAEIASGAVGYITEPAQAEQIVATGQADVVLLGRQMLRDPYWPLHAAKALHVDVQWPNQYLRDKQPLPDDPTDEPGN